MHQRLLLLYLVLNSIFQTQINYGVVLLNSKDAPDDWRLAVSLLQNVEKQYTDSTLFENIGYGYMNLNDLETAQEFCNSATLFLHFYKNTQFQ